MIENLQTLVVLLILIGIVVLAISRMRKSGGGCDCSGCGKSCPKRTEDFNRNN